MKIIFKRSIAIVFSLVIAFSFNFTTVFAAGSVKVSLTGESSCLANPYDYKVTLEVSDTDIGGVQGTIIYDKAIFDFVNVSVKGSIAKVNRLVKKEKDVTTAKDIIRFSEDAGTVDFVILSDGKSSELITFNFVLSGEIPENDGNYFTLSNVKVSQSGGAKRVETVNITNLQTPHHNFGEWSVTTEPTLFTVGEKSRTCLVCSTKETAQVEKLGAPKAELKFVGATRIVLEKRENTQYSIDGVVWQNNNVITGLVANTEYKVYSRLIESASNNVSGISKALNVETVNIDCIVGEVGADRLSQIRKILLYDKKIAWADVNGDAVIDIRDIIRIKKVSAGYYSSYKTGDFNEDGVVDNNDATILSDYLSGKTESIRSYLGDLNGDGVLDVNDLSLINN